MSESVEAAVARMIQERAKVGMEKYGVSVGDRTDLSVFDGYVAIGNGFGVGFDRLGVFIERRGSFHYLHITTIPRPGSWSHC